MHAAMMESRVRSTSVVGVLASQPLPGRVAARMPPRLLVRSQPAVLAGAAQAQQRRLRANAATDQASAAAEPPMATGATASTDDWEVKYLYDGDCSLCRSNKALLERQPEGRKKIKFVNIASVDYEPEDNAGIEWEDAMDTIHVVKRNGEIIKGSDALLLLFDTAGIGMAGRLGTLPVVSSIIEAMYQVINKLRLPVGNAFDGVLAAHRMAKVEEGVEHCVDDEEECSAPEW